MNEQSAKQPQTGFEIAVIGMAGKFPGASNIETFWKNLKNGVESVSFFSSDEMIDAGIEPDTVKKSNYVRAKGHMEDIRSFDSEFFNYPPNEAAIMDPQIRLFHECAWEALENSGYDPRSYRGLIGLFAGYSPNILWKAGHLIQTRNGAEFVELENLNSISFPTLICYKLDLKGPGVSVNSACSTSLVAIHMACRALLTGDADMVLAGGVYVTLPSKAGYLYQDGMILSSTGHCCPFDAKSDGTVSGNGVGIVVLKRLVKALKDRDHIYAVIKGTAINNDGCRKTGYTAPSVVAQSEVIRAALRMAAVEAETISYIETHGTGTPLGDLIEIEALKMAFANTTRKKFCRLGFIKANIGHLDAASGIAGFIKTVLALYNRFIPPAVNFDTPNPKIDFENSPFYIDKNPSEWKSELFPLRAGVSSFGIGGTNAHIILEEPVPPTDRAESSAKAAIPPVYFHNLLLLSAKTQTALDTMTKNLADYLKQNPGSELADVAYTLQVGRSPFNHRRILISTNPDDASAGLLSTTPGKVRSYSTYADERPIVFMFPGLGSQYVGMGAELYHTEPVFQETMERCFEILKNLGEPDIKEILYPSPVSAGVNNQSAEIINRFEIAQVVIFIFEYALTQLLIKWGIKPHSLIGYSFGEYVAACIAGVFSLEDALIMATYRGKLIRELPPTAMTSVPINKEIAKSFLNDRLFIAIDNGESCIIAGSTDDIDAFEKQMREKRYICIRLFSSHALHTPLMNSIQNQFEAFVGRMTLNKPKINFISNVTGKWINPQDAVNPKYWVAHLKETVRFADGLKELMAIEDAIFLEVGPGVALSTLAYQFIRKKSNQSVVNLVHSPDQKITDMEYLTNKVGLLWLYGIQIDWTQVYAGEKRKRVPLPSYPFDKIYYDVDIPIKNLNTYGQTHAGEFVKQPLRPSLSSYTGNRHDQKTLYVAPRNRVEQLLVEMWQELLGIRPIGIHDNLLEMGVTSLKGIMFVNLFREKLGEIIHVTAIFDAPTIAELAAYFSKHYPESLAKITGVQPLDSTTLDSTTRSLSLEKENVTLEKIMRFRRFLPDIPGPLKHDSPKNPRAVFVLSPPRTGSTLLRVILGGHPRLFAPPELNLLAFNTLAERKSVFSGPAASHLQGTIRALMEIKKCSVEEAQEMMEHFETQGITVKEFYRQIQEWIGDQILVEKSPGYSNDIDIMERCEPNFQEPLYIHLMRHPYGMIHSFVEAKMDLLNGEQVTGKLNLTRRELAEVIYTNSVINIREFLKKIPHERQLPIKFEDLVAKPEDTAKNICRFLNLEFDPEMLHPYKEKKKRMTDGVYSEGQMIGDPKFHQHKDINTQVVEKWKQDYTEDFLGKPTLEIAENLGYAPIHENKKEIKNADALTNNLSLMNRSPEATVNIFIVHERIGLISSYLDFCRLLEPQFNCWGIEPHKLKNYAPQNWTIEDTATKYIQSLKKIQPQGPYYIFTWSFGGHIAFEMTRQMEQIGDTVALLAFVDCSGPLGSRDRVIQEFSLETEKEYIKQFFPSADIQKRLDKVTNIDHVWYFTLDLFKSGQIDLEELKPLLLELTEINYMPNFNRFTPEYIITYLNYHRSFKSAGNYYVPSGNIHTPIHYFRATDSIKHKIEHWNDYCHTPVIYHDIVADHHSIFHYPQVIELTRLFKEVFDSINKN